MKLIYTLLLSISLNSCGIYSFTGASIPAEAKTVSVQYFNNKAATVQPTLSQVFTERLKDMFLEQTNLTLNENEGDLVFCASDVTAEKINFMAKYGRGLICLALNSSQAKKLDLNYMSPVNQSRNQTAFTVSIEAKKGVTTGISAKDRARTIKVATKKNVSKNEIISPGHVFPIISKDGGVLVRAGHTEASVDISKLAKKK